MLPMDVQRAEVDEADLVAAPRAPSLAPPLESLDLCGVERPLIIAGSGVYYAGAGPALVECAERLRIPVQTPIWSSALTCTDPASARPVFAENLAKYQATLTTTDAATTAVATRR